MSRNLSALLGVSLWLTGCGREPAPNVPQANAPAGVLQIQDPATAPADAGSDAKAVDTLLATYATPGKQELYDKAMNEALGYFAEKKFARALASLEDAQAIDNTEQVRSEMERARDLIAQQAAAERSARDARVILDQGQADAAGQVLTESLKQFGGSDAAEELTSLKRQADALTAEGLRGDPERRDRFGARRLQPCKTTTCV